MPDQEYFVRKPDSENARGPFNLEKLKSLAEAGQVDRESLYYDAATENWKKVGDNPGLCAHLFPEKVKLTLKKKSPVAGPQEAEIPEAKRPAPAISLKKRSEPQPKPEPSAPATPEEAPAQAPKLETAPVQAPSEPPPPAQAQATEAPPQNATPTTPPILQPPSARSGLSVDDLLSAAEGQTDEMTELREARKWRDRAVSMAMPLMAILMLLSGAALLYPWRDEIVKVITDGENWMSLVEQPRIILGAVDILLALLLGLAVASVYMVLRLRLAIGLGYLGYLAFAEHEAGSPAAAIEMLALAIFSTGVFICTVTTRFALMLLCALAALASILVLGAIWNMPGILQ
jgi:hypothetical protein